MKCNYFKIAIFINMLTILLYMGDIKYFEEKGKLYKIDSDGEKYRISFSEELQLKNLRLAKDNKKYLEFHNRFLKAILSSTKTHLQ